MYVLIQGCGGENVKVTGLVGKYDLTQDGAIKEANDIIREYLSDNELTSDITYEAADHPLGPGPLDGLVGAFIANDLYWELWEV